MVRVVRWKKKKEWASSASDGGLEGESWPQERIYSTEKEDGSPFHVFIHLSIVVQLTSRTFPMFSRFLPYVLKLNSISVGSFAGAFSQKSRFCGGLNLFLRSIRSVLKSSQPN